jgi:two-component system, cell cycle sensor histidine kinase and response regulator CckA
MNEPREEASSSQVLSSARIRLSDVVLDPTHGLEAALQAVAAIAADTLHVARVSVWRFIDAGRAIRCTFLYQPGWPHVSDSAVLRASDIPNYLRTLDGKRVVPVVDSATDPLAGEFRDLYLKPLGISAMLDAPIVERGRVVGIVCHEHIGPPRQWTQTDGHIAAAVADAVARLYAETARLQAERALSSYERHAQKLQHLSMLGRTAAGIAHDFRNYLTVVVASSEDILEAAADNPAVVEAARRIIEASEHVGTMVRELMALGQDRVLSPRILDPRDVLERSQALLQAAAGSAVSLTVAPGPPVRRVLIDPVQLERALVNLVVNARDAMPAGGHIRIDIAERPGSGRSRGAEFVTISVRDTGAGIEEATLERVFEPFFTTKGDVGSGLGLATVQQIVVLAGGRVEIESEVDVGTTVRLLLPAIAPPDDRSGSAA